MSHFMVRIWLRSGLRSAAEAEELQLSLAMEAEGFSQLIRGSGGAAFQLPPGEYYIAGAYTRDEVLAKAKKCMAEISRGCAILVTQGEAFMWCGLKKAHLHVTRAAAAS